MAHDTQNAVMLIGPDGRGALIDRETAARLLEPCKLQRPSGGPRNRQSTDRRRRCRTADFVIRGRICDVTI